MSQSPPIWRDFRMTTASCDRNDAPLPKIWTLRLRLRVHELRTMEASMGKLSAVSKFSHAQLTAWR